MKILLAGTLVGKGGIQSHLRWLASALSEANVHTHLLSIGCNVPSPEDLWSISAIENRYLTVTFLSPSMPGRNTSLSRLWSIKQIIRDFSPSVYLATGTGWNLFIPPILNSGRLRRIFFEVMSGVPSRYVDSRWGVKWWFDEVVGQSPTVAETFRSCFGWDKMLCAIPAMPEPLEHTAVLPKPIVRKVDLGHVRAAFFSRLVPHKQAFWLVQQWDELKNFLAELHIHGSGPEEPLIRAYIDQKGIGDRVKCFGRYPEGQAYVNLLSSYDLTLLPTIGAEGAPIVLLESMACGVPFVAYGAGGIGDYGVNNPNVIILPLETGAFIDGVEKMVHQLASGQINQVELQQYYLKNYSYHILKQQWLNYLLE